MSTADNAGTAKIEFNIYLDPTAIVSIDGNEYTPKEVEEPIQLKAGSHQVSIKQLGIQLSPQEFTVETGKRKIVRTYEPERVAAEVVVGLGGPVHIMVNGQKIEVRKVGDFPPQRFAVVGIILNGNVNLSDEHFRFFQNVLTNLEYLHLRDTQITDVALERIKELTKLRELWLVNTAVTDAGLAHIKGLPNLVSFDVNSAKVTDAGLVNLKDLAQLEQLGLSCIQVSDAGLLHLKGLRNLTGINLINTKVTDAGLEHLKGLVKLSKVMLGNTRVTDAGIVGLKAALPNCEVVR